MRSLARPSTPEATPDVTPPASPVLRPRGQKLRRSHAVILTRDSPESSSVPNSNLQSFLCGGPFIRLPPRELVPDASEIVPRLYISDVFTAISGKTLDSLGITHILTVMLEADVPKADLSALQIQPVRHVIPILDRTDASLKIELDDAVTFITDALVDPRSRILCHCYAGASRSPSVVIAYLVSSRGMDVDEALAFVRSKRSITRPNIGFIAQLRAWERDTRNDVSHEFSEKAGR